MKRYTIIAIIIVGIILGFLTGLYLYKINRIKTTEKKIVAETIEDDCTAIVELSDKEWSDLVETNNKEEKTSPNCKVILKVYYEDCEHLIETRKNIEEAEVNLAEEELKERFTEWEIHKFTPNEIVLYKEVNGFCNEHFLLKEEDGYITIYKLDKNNNAELFRETEISTEYLAEEDLRQIRNGIKVYTEKELNKTLEDFE